jgi:hypothetical protein
MTPVGMGQQDAVDADAGAFAAQLQFLFEGG